MMNLKNNYIRILLFFVIGIFVFDCKKKEQDSKWSEAPLPVIYNNLENNVKLDSPNLAFVCHITHSIVTVIDLQTKKIIGKIPSGNGSNSFILSNNKKTAYITNFHSNDITIIETENIRNKISIPVGVHPVCITLTANEQMALISHQSKDGLWFMDTKTNQIIKKITEGTGTLSFCNRNKKIYQPVIFHPYVFVINPEDLSISKRIEVGGRPLELAFTSDCTNAYVTNFDLDEIEIIDTKIDSIVHKIINIGNPRGIAITPDDHFALVTNVVSNTVTIIDIHNNSLFKTISVGRMPTDIVITKDGKYAYITNQGSASISILDIEKYEVVSDIEVADNPITICLN